MRGLTAASPCRHREREAPRRTPFTLCNPEARLPTGTGPFALLDPPWRIGAQVAALRSRSSLTTCRRTCAGTGRRASCTKRGRRAPRSRGPPTASLRLCPCTPQSATWCGRLGMCMAGLDPWTQVDAQPLCSETPTPDEALACGHSRSGIRLIQPCRVRLVAQDPGFSTRLRGFESRTRCQNRSLRGAHASQAEIGRNDWAAPEPVTGWNVLR